MIQQKCTECGQFTEHRYGEYWNHKNGHIIKPFELLCYKCACKRHGFKTLKQIHEERNQTNSIMKIPNTMFSTIEITVRENHETGDIQRFRFEYATLAQALSEVYAKFEEKDILTINCR